MDDWLLDWKIRMSYAIATGPRYKTLKRPSWLHPYRRVMWVHHHGPHTPTVRIRVGNPRSLGVLTGVTS